MDNHVVSTRVLDALTALKDKAEAPSDNSLKEGVDLLSIVKKLSRNRERVARNGK